MRLAVARTTLSEQVALLVARAERGACKENERRKMLLRGVRGRRTSFG